MKIKAPEPDLPADDELIMVTPTLVENGGSDWSKRAEIMDSNLGELSEETYFRKDISPKMRGDMAVMGTSREAP